MAIQNKFIESINTTAYSSSGETALTIMSFCNYGSTTTSITMHIVQNGQVPGLDNVFIKDIDIVPGDTYIVYQGGEKIILSNSDFINVIASQNNSITCLTSYMVI